MGILGQNVQASHQGNLEKIKAFLYKKNYCFNPVPAVFFAMMGQKIHTYVTNFFEDYLSV